MFHVHVYSTKFKHLNSSVENVVTYYCCSKKLLRNRTLNICVIISKINARNCLASILFLAKNFFDGKLQNVLVVCFTLDFTNLEIKKNTIEHDFEIFSRWCSQFKNKDCIKQDHLYQQMIRWETANSMELRYSLKVRYKLS